MGRVCSQSLLPTRHGRRPGATPELSRHRPRPVGAFTGPRRFHPNPLVFGSGNGGRRVAAAISPRESGGNSVPMAIFSPGHGGGWSKWFAFHLATAVATPDGPAFGPDTAVGGPNGSLFALPQPCPPQTAWLLTRPRPWLAQTVRFSPGHGRVRPKWLGVWPGHGRVRVKNAIFPRKRRKHPARPAF